MHSSIMQLKSKTNTLTRTIEETRSEIKDMESGLETKILQNAKEIELEAKRAISAEVELAAAIKITADNITAEVKRAQGQEVELAAAIKITADNIKLKVSKGDVSSEISQESGKIKIEANRISIKSDKFTLTEDGKIQAVDGEFSGEITVKSGTIGGFTITDTSLYNSKNSIDSSGSGVFISTTGINIGDSNNYLKIKTSGSLTIKVGDKFKLDNDEMSYGSSVFNSNGIKIRKSASSSDPEIKVSNSIVMKYDNGTKLEISSGGISMVASGSYPANMSIGSGGLEFRDSTSNTANKIIINASSIKTSNTNLSITASGSNSVKIGGSNNKIGFFGGTGATKKTVSSMTETPTVDNLKTKVNAIISALKDYNLIA